jgi:hypothetical protein
MQRSAIFLGQPITGIEGQELDLGSFGQIRRLVNDKPPGLQASLQRHATTVASAPPRNKVLEPASGSGARQSRPGRYPSARNREVAKKSRSGKPVRDRGVGGSNPRPDQYVSKSLQKCRLSSFCRRVKSLPELVQQALHRGRFVAFRQLDEVETLHRISSPEATDRNQQIQIWPNPIRHGRR